MSAASSFIVRSASETALDYAAIDFAVFPIAWDCRTPLCEHGCKDASTDPVEVVRLWAGRTSTNVAVATGAPSGFFALDIDVKGGKDGFAALAALEAANGPIPQTWQSHTPSGGTHILFAQPAARVLRNRVNLPVFGFEASGLDVRSTGGSIALPPSRKPEGVYEWIVDPLAAPLAGAPDWLLELIDPPAPVRAPAPPFRLTSSERAARYVAAAVNAECGDLARMAPGSGRNLALFQAAARLGEFVGADLLPQSMAEDALQRAAEECGLVHEDGSRSVRATIASGMARGIAHPRQVCA